MSLARAAPRRTRASAGPVANVVGLTGARAVAAQAPTPSATPAATPMQEHLEAAVAADPRHGDAWYNLALAHVEQGPMDEAVTCLRRALEVSPDNHAVL